MSQEYWLTTNIWYWNLLLKGMQVDQSRVVIWRKKLFIQSEDIKYSSQWFFSFFFGLFVFISQRNPGKFLCKIAN